MTSKQTDNGVRVLLIRRENGSERLVCDAELVFGDGPLAGMKLVGFCLWNGADVLAGRKHLFAPLHVD